MDNRDMGSFGNQARDILLKKLLSKEEKERKESDEKLAQAIEDVDGFEIIDETDKNTVYTLGYRIKLINGKPKGVLIAKERKN